MTNQDAIKTLHELWRETNDSWYQETYNLAISALKAQDVPDTNVGDTISRQAAIDLLLFAIDDDWESDYAEERMRELPSAQPEIVKCKDCKYFELDHFEKIETFPIPIIVAHEVCMKWGNGCQSNIDGWCFFAERKTDE